MASNSKVNSTGYGSSEDENTIRQSLHPGTLHKEVSDNEDYLLEHDGLSEYEQYGTTPPRTRILRRNRERKQREVFSWSAGRPRMFPNKRILNRRNTVSNTFDELFAKADNADLDQGGKRTNKRSLKLLRGSERDLKLDIASAQLKAANTIALKAEQTTNHPFIQVEGCRRFMSLCSRRVPQQSCNSATNEINETNKEDEAKTEIPQSRIDFHNTLSMLVRMGCGEKSLQERGARRHISREEYIWQNELKDLIWLELQAWHADRSPAEHDSHLCDSRKNIVDLINDIMSYRFNRHKHHSSTHSNDSGVEDDCPGCLSMICHSCLEAQHEGLKDIEKLMNRLEAAESLFPSSKAFAGMYPTYNSPEFVGRVKAMCLWYNMTRHQLLKIIILARLLTLEDKLWLWPIDLCSDTNSVDSSSSSDSNSSTSSVNYCININTPVVLTSISPLIKCDSQTKLNPYRKYIENMLKTKGLMKSLRFLETLHVHLLQKTQVTLAKPCDEEVFTKTPADAEEELERYGCWSPEAKALGLPSYKAAFLFLSSLPLEVIKEFLCMRLEQKPENPSPLSVRQLLRELKEGIRVATKYRQRVLNYINAALNDLEMQGHIKETLADFDKHLLQVYELYLEYMEDWALLQHESFQKCLLEEEWNYSCEISYQIPGGQQAAGKRFCRVLTLMLGSIGERLLGRIEECALFLKTCSDDTNKKQTLFVVCRELQQLYNEERERCIKTVAFTKHIFKANNIPQEYLLELKKSVITFNCTIPSAIEKVQTICDTSSFDDLDEAERLSLISRCREILHQGYRLGFEYYKVISELIPNNRREKLARSMAVFAHLWMKFVKERCERGRGMRPRWAYQGLEFLLMVCEPEHTVYLNEEEFKQLKHAMDSCISHVIGTNVPTTPDSGFHSTSPRIFLDTIKSLPRSRGSSPSPKARYISQRSTVRKTSTERSPQAEHLEATLNGTDNNIKHTESLPEIVIKLPPLVHCDRVREAIESLDSMLDEKLHDQQLIGRVVKRIKDPSSRVHIKHRHVTFTWQRGIKIGQGRFGKVYTAVNNNTGEMMAVKEIAFQYNDKHAIRKVVEEVKILEGISHQHLVKYYGLEVHKDEMLLFMEFCAEGTLENLVAGTENGLPELLIRRYTYQLVSGVAELHSHGIVHRDIKSANIFLTDDGNCLKIGDFGCATKIMANTTLPGELQGFVGTQAYMAPEMFMKTGVVGHGRAADIWSIGCVVVEMASGKRPWAEYDSNYQIMFKVGMGEKPEVPDYLIDEGHEFLDHCLQHNPKDRWSAIELLEHNFVNIGDDLT